MYGYLNDNDISCDDYFGPEFKPLGSIDDPIVLVDQTDVRISVYLDDSRIFQYAVTATTAAMRDAKVRDHVHAIGLRGLIVGSAEGVTEYYPPHRISKIKAEGDFGAPKYSGQWGGA